MQKDASKAVKYLRYAADNNHSLASYLLGKLYRTGNGVPKDEEDFLQELKEHLDRNSREKLLKLVDLGIELREETSLAAFIDGFQPALGIARELTPYTPLPFRKSATSN